VQGNHAAPGAGPRTGRGPSHGHAMAAGAGSRGGPRARTSARERELGRRGAPGRAAPGLGRNAQRARSRAGAPSRRGAPGPGRMAPWPEKGRKGEERGGRVLPHGGEGERRRGRERDVRGIEGREREAVLGGGADGWAPPGGGGGCSTTRARRARGQRGGGGGWATKLGRQMDPKWGRGFTELGHRAAAGPRVGGGRGRPRQGEAGWAAAGSRPKGGKREFPLSNSYLALNSTPKYFSQITQP
jgi:hypothetical protein